MLTTDDIWTALRQRKLSANKIARHLGLHTTTVSRAINGERRNPDPRILPCIAELIGVSPEELAPGTRTALPTTKPINQTGPGSMPDSPEVPPSTLEKETA